MTRGSVSETETERKKLEISREGKTERGGSEKERQRTGMNGF